MNIGIIAPDRDMSGFVSKLRSLNSTLEISVWPDILSPETIEYVLVWNPPPGCFQNFTPLKFCCSLGAGVDEIVYRTDIKDDVLIGRIVDDKLSNSIAKYCLMCVLMVENNMDIHLANMASSKWDWIVPRKDLNVGVLGLGEIGIKVTKQLIGLGFNVAGYSRSQKDISGVSTYHGDQQFPEFLSKLDVLISVLPLTKESTQILSYDTFSHCKDGVTIVNVGRGLHLNESDLLEALSSGKVKAAILDVFEKEPLPADHPYWHHPKIFITPHVAGITDQASAAIQFYESISKHAKGLQPDFIVNRAKGY